MREQILRDLDFFLIFISNANIIIYYNILIYYYIII